MAEKGILVDYEYCAGCHTCEVACMQENDLPVGQFGIKVEENIYVTPEGRTVIDYIPEITEICNLCMRRTAKGQLPSCVKHCQCRVMTYGDVDDLVKEAQGKEKIVILAPR